jgi:integrase
MQVLNPEEVRMLLDACADEQLKTIIFTAVGTGMRVGELPGLRWSDLDLPAGAAYVARAAQYLPGSGVTFRTPKTARSRRNVALSPDTVRVLREHRAWQAERRLASGSGYEDSDLVFAVGDGRPLSPNNVSQAFLRLEKRLGIEPVRFHDLRHTAATLMLKAGIHPKIVSERLGHSTINITLDTYSHVLPDMQREAAATLDRILAT